MEKNELTQDELTPYERYQLKKYGNILKQSPGADENSLSEIDRFSEWVNAQAENQILDKTN